MVSVIAWLLGIFCAKEENDFENLIGNHGNTRWNSADLTLIHDHIWQLENTEMWKPIYTPVS